MYSEKNEEFYAEPINNGYVIRSIELGNDYVWTKLDLTNFELTKNQHYKNYQIGLSKYITGNPDQIFNIDDKGMLQIRDSYHCEEESDEK